MTLEQSRGTTDTERARVANVQSLGAGGAAGVTNLVEMLADPSWVVRRAVVESLAKLGDVSVISLCDVLRSRRDSEARLAAAVDALVCSTGSVEREVLKLLPHENPAVVADAAQILGRRRSQTALPSLVQLTKHSNDNVAVSAIEALGHIGGRAAVEALIESVNSKNFFRVFPAIDVLGRSGDPRVVEPLTKLLSDPVFLLEAARALGRSGERAALKPLVELLISPSDSVVRIASVAIWDLRQRFEEKTGGDTVTVDEFLRANIGSEAIRRLSQILFHTTNDPEVRVVCKLFGLIGNAEATPVLAKALDAPSSVATCAAQALKKIGKNADEPLIRAIREGSSARRKVLLPVVSRSSAAQDVAQCLKDPDPEVRALACDTLARLSNVNVVKDLFPLLLDSNLRVVHSATAAIQALGTGEARELAREATLADNPVVRRSALRILSYFGDEEALDPMLKALSDSDPRVREAAIQGLPFLEDARALEALYEQSRNSNPRVRGLAMRSLGQLPKASERALSVLLKGLRDDDAWVRYYACQSLGRMEYVSVAGEIAQLLQDEAGQVRVASVEALSHLDSPIAYEALRQAATTQDVEARRAALVGLGIAHRDEDLPVVLNAVSAPDAPTRLMALSALVNFPSGRVLGALSSAATDSSEQVSSAAIDFLSARPEQEATEVLVELLKSEATRDRARAALLVASEGRSAGLLVALESANDEFAPILISVLSRLETPEARSALLWAMKLNNAAARKAAATSLAARRDPELIAAVREAEQNDPDPEVRKICTLVLKA
ncbi:MAG: HEAT repeat domain-containing protein [Bdellovibrionales bacterium]